MSLRTPSAGTCATRSRSSASVPGSPSPASPWSIRNRDRVAGHASQPATRSPQGTLRQRPMLVAAAVAGVQDQLRAVGGVGGGIVEAFAGGRVDYLPVLRLPLLVGAAVAGPQLDEGAVGVVGAGDVHAAAVDGQGAVAVDGPVLRGGVAVAGPDLHLVAVGAVAVVAVHALGTAEAGHDRPGRPAGAGRCVAGGDDAGLDGVFGGG